MKTIIVILGAGASGKSTLSRGLCGSAAREYVHGGLQEKYALGGGFAVPGSLKNGSDSIGVMAKRAALVLELLKLREIDCVVLDGVRSSRLWDVDWVQALPNVAVLYVHIELSEAENIQRLMRRRAANGKVEHALPEKTYANMLAFRRRAASVFAAARRAYNTRPAKFITFGDDVRPTQAINVVRNAVTHRTLKDHRVQAAA